MWIVLVGVRFIEPAKRGGSDESDPYEKFTSLGSVRAGALTALKVRIRAHLWFMRILG